MFRIGEFSKLTQVSVRMLRHYDETGLFKPAEIDSWTGYRMYSAAQIPVLNKIIYLRDSGFNIAEISTALKSENTIIIGQLEQKSKDIQSTIQLEQEKLKKIELAKHELLNGTNEMHYNISLKSIPSLRVLSLRKVICNYYAEAQLWGELSAFMKQHNIACSDDTFSTYHDKDYREEDVDVELCVIVDTLGEDAGPFKFRDTEPVPLMAYTMVYGDFSNIASAYLAFAKWLQDHSQYKMKDENRQIVHRGPWNEEHSENYLTELQIPLEPNI